MDRNNSSLTRMTGTLETASKGFGLLATAAVAMAPAAVAGVAVLSAGLIGVSGIIASTGAAMGVFGLTAKAQFTALTTGYQNIQKLKEAAAAAPAGSAAQIADYKALATAQDQYAKTFGPAAAGMNNLQTAWTNWKTATAGQTNQVLADGLNLIATALPKLKPLFDTGAQAATAFLLAIKGWVTGGGMDNAVKMLNNLAQAVGPSIQATMRNLASIAGALAPLFYDLGIKVAAGMASITGAMASWMGNKGADAMNSFMAYITANGPAVWNLLKTIADAAVNIVRALAPLAPVSLAIATALAQLVAAAPPGVIQAVAVAFVAYSLAMKGLLITATIGEAVKGLTSAMFGLDIAMNANVIGLIVIAIAAFAAGVAYAWTHCATFRVIVEGAFNAVKSVVMGVVSWFQASFIPFFTTTLPNAFTSGWNTVTSFFAGLAAKIEAPFIEIKNFIVSSFDTWWASNGAALVQVWNGIWNAITTVVRTVWAIISPIIQAGMAIISGAINTGMAVVQAVWNAAWLVISTAVKIAWGVVQAILTAGMAVLQAAWNLFWAVLGNTLKVVWAGIQAVIKVAWDLIVGIFDIAIALLTGHWNAAWVALQTTATQVWNAIKAFFTVTWAAIQAIFTAALTFIQALLSAGWNLISSVAQTVWNAIKAFFTTWWNGLKADWNAALEFVKGILSTAWNAISAVAQTVWNAIKAFFTTWWNGLKADWQAAVTFVEGILSTAWNAISSTAQSLWNTLKGWFDTFWGTLKSSFQTGVDGIQAVWDTLKAVASAPVEFIVNTVYDEGIVPIVNAVGSLIGLHLNPITFSGFAEGGKVQQGTTATADDVLVRVSRGETIVSAAHSQQLAPAFGAIGVPGYATGGIPFGNIIDAVSAFVNPVSITQNPNTIGALASLTGDALAAAASAILNPLLGAVPTFGVPLGEGLKKIPVKIVDALVTMLKNTGMVGGGDIVADAKSWIGKIPYVWGGTTLGPGGADCSGFTQAIYGRHGISAPRTSEAQGAWVKRGSPTAGGLAFYHSPAGGADPGHVAIVADAANVVSQGGGMGPQMMALNGMPLLWTGIPPGGLPAAATGAAAGPAGSAAAGSVKALAQQQAAALGWTGAQWDALNAVEMAEAGWSLTATNPTSGAYGIAQFINGASEYAQYGGNSGSAAGQITGFLMYIAQRYGTPTAAWAHEQAYGWYDRGSWNVPVTGPAMVHQGEMILPAQFAEVVRGGGAAQPDLAAELRALRGQMAELIRTTAAVPAATGHHVGGALAGAAGAAGFRNRYPAGGS